MEKLSKNILDIEKSLTEMKNEITNIKNSTNNTNATNSLNISNNYQNKNSHRNEGKFFKSKNNLKLSKNYFQLSAKEKYFPNKKNLLEITHSFSLNKNGFNIYNNKFLNFKSNNDDFNSFEKEEELNEIIKNNLILEENKKNSNLKLFKRYFSNNNIKIDNNSTNKNNGNIKSIINKTFSKKINKSYKNLKSLLFSNKRKKIKNKNEINFKFLINYNLPQEELESKYLNQNNFLNSYQSTNDDNKNINNISHSIHNRNHKNKNVDLANKNKKIKIYSQILNILKEDSINNLISKSNLFDKYGTEGFEDFINNNKIMRSKNNLNNIYECLKEYKNFICNKFIND